MTEHPTSHNRRQAATPAAASGTPEDAHGAAPDPRNAVRQTAAPGQEPGGGRPRPAFPADGPAAAPGSGDAPAPEPDGTSAEGEARPQRRGRRAAKAAPRGGGTKRAGGGTQARNTAQSEQPEHGTPEGEPVWDADRNAARGAARRPGARDDAPSTAAGEHPAPARPTAASGDVAAAGEVAYTTPEGGMPAVPPSDAPGADGSAALRDRSGDRLRFVGAATRRIARGIDLDEIVLGLCRATVPTFADAILVYLRDPLPVGDERPVGPLVLRLRRTDRIPLDPDTESGRLPLMSSQPDLAPAVGGGPAAELCEVRGGRSAGRGAARGAAGVRRLAGRPRRAARTPRRRADGADRPAHRCWPRCAAAAG